MGFVNVLFRKEKTLRNDKIQNIIFGSKLQKDCMILDNRKYKQH